MATKLILKIDDFSHSGTWEIEPPDEAHEWELVCADVKVNAPTPRNDHWWTHVAVVWRQKGEQEQSQDT